MGAYVCIYGHICAYIGHVCAHIGECVLESCAVQLAACDCKYPESAHLLASHSLPTAPHSQSSFFRAFGTSKIGGEGTFRGGRDPMCGKIQVQSPKWYMPYIYYYTPLPLNLANKQQQQASNKHFSFTFWPLLGLIAPGSTLL